MHFPALHVTPAGHFLPHAPQLFASVSRSTSQPSESCLLQSTRVALHAGLHGGAHASGSGGGGEPSPVTTGDPSAPVASVPPPPPASMTANAPSGLSSATRSPAPEIATHEKIPAMPATPAMPRSTRRTRSPITHEKDIARHVEPNSALVPNG